MLRAPTGGFRYREERIYPGGCRYREERVYPGDAARLARLEARAAALTPRRIRRASREPFLLSTTPEEKLAEMQSLGWKAALGTAPLPLALAALLVWLRYG